VDRRTSGFFFGVGRSLGLTGTGLLHGGCGRRALVLVLGIVIGVDFGSLRLRRLWCRGLPSRTSKELLLEWAPDGSGGFGTTETCKLCKLLIVNLRDVSTSSIGSVVVTNGRQMTWISFRSRACAGGSEMMTWVDTDTMSISDRPCV